MDRLARLRTLRSFGAPRWLIKNEQVRMITEKRKLSVMAYSALFDKYVAPIMGHGSITVPDGE